MKKFILAFTAIISIGLTAAFANYTMTQGAGTTFGSVIVGGFHYVQMFVCDLTTPAQCQSVSAAGAAKVDGSAVTQPVSSATLSTAANQATEIASLATIVTNTGASTPAGTNTIGTVGQLPYPVGAVPLTASATGTTAATTATLAGAVGKTTYICSLSVRANATANANVTDTVTGVITGTLSRALWVPANTAGLGVDEMIYNPCVPASATNTAIAVVSGAPGTGGVVTVNATGYQL